MQDSHQHYSDSNTLHHSLDMVQERDGLHKPHLHEQQGQTEVARVADSLAAEVAQAESRCHFPLSHWRHHLMWVCVHQPAMAEGMLLLWYDPDC